MHGFTRWIVGDSRSVISNDARERVESNDETLDVNDPCCPSADGYGDYRDREQIERQSKEVAKLKQEQQDHVSQHFAKSTRSAPPAYNVQRQVWYYRDNTSGAMQGPFSGEQMMGWRAFFSATTPVRFGHDGGGDFVALAEVDFVEPPLPPVPVPPPPPPPEPVKPGEATDVASYPVVRDDIDDADDSAENELEQTPEEEAIMPPLTAEDDDLKPSTSEADIAEPPPAHDEDAEVEMCLPPPSDDEDIGEESGNGPEVEMCLPPPSDDENDADGVPEEEMCLPPPSDDEDEVGEASYPAVGEYHIPDDEDAVPYPADVEYPVDDDYPDMEYPDTSYAYGDATEIAAVAPYPTDDVDFGVTSDAVTEDQQQSGGMQEVMHAMPPVEEKKKKEYAGDKAVVGFMPSHLRVKRTVAAKPTKKKKTAMAKQSLLLTSDSAPVEDGAKKQEKYSVADDYNKFMEEISELK